jgi:tetratricopeptide (TPR) repeat protein/S1-C subfamily serine protease
MNYLSYIPLLAATGSLWVFLTPLAWGQARTLSQPLSSVPTIAQASKYTGIVKEVDDIAEKITVKIDSKYNGNGSGVIIAKQGRDYYVLTAGHVVGKKSNLKNKGCDSTNQEQEKYNIITPDGKNYEVKKDQITCFKGVDIAVVKFTSDKTYQMATLADYSLFGSKSPIFISGFPTEIKKNNYQRKLTTGFFLESQFDITQARKANFLIQDFNSLRSELNMLYTALSSGGMSGGPVLDNRGRLIGINTGTEWEPDNQKIKTYLGYSLGVSVKSFLARLKETNIKPENLNRISSLPPNLSDSENDSIINQLKTSPPSKNATAEEWLNYGNELWRVKKYFEAITAFDQAVNLAPNFAEAYYGRSVAKWSNQKQPTGIRRSEALADLEQAIKLKSNFVEAWRKKGEVIGYSDPIAAIAAYEKATEATKQSRKDFLPFLQLCSSLSDFGFPERAFTACTKSLDLQPTALGYYTRGFIYYVLTSDNWDNHQRAIADYDQAIELAPDFAFAYESRAKAYSWSGNCQKAIADYTKLIEIEPNNKNYYSERAECYKLLNNLKKAETDFKKAQEIELSESNRKQPQDKPLNNPEDNFGFFVYYNESTTYLNLSHLDYPKAIDNLNKSIELYPDYYEAYIRRGDSYNSLGDYQKAIENFNQAISLRPNAIEAYQRLGEAYEALKNDVQAIANFTKVIELNPRSYSGYSSRGYFYFTLKDYQKALADFTTIIEKNLASYLLISPEFKDITYRGLNGSAYVSRGAVYSKLNQYEAAVKDYGKAIEMNFGWIDSLKSNPKGLENVLATFEKAITMNPNNVEAYINRGNIYIQTGNKQKAIEDLQKAAQLFQQQGNTASYETVMGILRQLGN